MDLTFELNREPDEKELAERLGLSVKRVRSIKKAIIKEPISLDTPVTDDLSVQDYIEDKSYKSPDEQAQVSDLFTSIPHLLEALDERERRILQHRFGLNKTKPKTLEQLGKILGFSKERIRQLEELAINKLRNNNQINNYREFLD